MVRDQSLAPPQVLAAVGLFGRVFPQHNTPFAIPDCPQIHYLSNQDRFPDGRRYIPGDGWHTDHSNAVRPPKATVLHAVTCRTRAATRSTPTWPRPMPACRPPPGSASPLMGIHVYQSSHSARKLMGLIETPTRSACPTPCCIPWCAPIRRAARKSIYLNPIRIEGILGLDHKEALPLLDELLAHGTRSASSTAMPGSPATS